MVKLNGMLMEGHAYIWIPVSVGIIFGIWYMCEKMKAYSMKAYSLKIATSFWRYYIPSFIMGSVGPSVTGDFPF